MEDFSGFSSEEVDNIDFKKYWNIVVKNWKSIAIYGVAAAVIGIIISFGMPRQYKVVAKVAPELSLRSNSLTSIASMAGINMNMLSNTNDALLPTVYPEIISSVPFVTDLFNMEANDSTLYYHMTEERKQSWIGFVFSLPGKAMGAITGLFENEEETEGIQTVDTFHLTKEQEGVYKALCRAIKVTVDKKTFLVTITVIMDDPIITARLAEAVISNLQRYVTRYRTDKAVENAQFLQLAFDNAKEDYYAVQHRYASYCDSHQEMLSQRFLVEKQKLMNEVNLAYQLYTSLAQQLQQAQVAVQKETPVFAEVYPPTTPLRKFKPQRKKIAFVFFILGVSVAFFRAYAKHKKELSI